MQRSVKDQTHYEICLCLANHKPVEYIAMYHFEERILASKPYNFPMALLYIAEKITIEQEMKFINLG